MCEATPLPCTYTGVLAGAGPKIATLSTMTLQVLDSSRALTRDSNRLSAACQHTHGSQNVVKSTHGTPGFVQRGPVLLRYSTQSRHVV